MTDQFSRFSESAKKILSTAQTVSENSGVALGTQHILISLASYPGTLSYELLRENRINVDQVRLLMSLYPGEPATGRITEPAKKVIEMAAEVAATFKHITIDAEHLLISLLELKECSAYQMLVKIGIDPRDLSQQIVELFEELVTLDQMMKKIGLRPGQEGGLPNNPRLRKQKVASGAKDRQKSPALDYFGIDLTAQAKEGKLDPVIGRDKEMHRLMQILLRKNKNNPLLVGEPGVGKTAIVEGLAELVNKGKIAERLSESKIIALDMALIVAGTTYRGQFEERLKKIVDEVKRDPNVILFIDEIHTIVGAGSAEGSLDAANIIKPALAKGELRLIGATTTNEYRKYIEKDASLGRRLQMIKVAEPSVDQTIEILNALKPVLENYHGVKIEESCISSAVTLAKRYNTERLLPDSAIDLLDEACAGVAMAKPKTAGFQKSKIEDQLAEAIEKKNILLSKGQFKDAERYRQDEQRLLSDLKNGGKDKSEPVQIVKQSDVASIIATSIGIPVGDLMTDEKKQLINLDKTLSELVIGQKEATDAIADTIKRAKAGVINESRPMGSFLFLGPTGVGKTLLAKTLAKEVFRSSKALVKIDMSEFAERHSVSGLVGAPPGYVGYEDAGRLTEPVKRQPYSVVLFDEIEKAHPDIYNILLQIFEDGYVTDSKGQKVSFNNTIIILTSNLGSGEISKQLIGFGKVSGQDQSKKYEDTKERIVLELKDKFRPELINRLDRIIVFNPLTMEAMKKIVLLELDKLKLRLFRINIELGWDDRVINWLAKEGFDDQLGARPLNRVIMRQVESPISELILGDKLINKRKVEVAVSAGKLIITQGLTSRSGLRSLNETAS